MTENWMYGSTRELMSSSDLAERGGDLNSSIKRKPGLLNRQRSSQSFEMGSKRIDQVKQHLGTIAIFPLPRMKVTVTFHWHCSLKFRGEEVQDGFW